MTVFFNEHDAFAAAWLRNLWPVATVDERSIHDVQASDLLGFSRCHFFGGIGGWEYALQLAGWPDEWPVWTGSCPCQPFSAAGKRKGEADERHLWPEFFRLIEQCRPPVAFGEQVASKDGLRWLDGVFADLEGAGYTCRAADSCAAGVGSPSIRQRLWWVAYAERAEPWSGEPGEQGRTGFGRDRLADGSDVGGLDDAPSDRAGNSGQAEPSGDGPHNGIPGKAGPWDDFTILPCRDNKYRRAERGSFPLASRIPRELGRDEPELRRLARSARANRTGRLRGYGNSIVPQVAAVFIRAAMEVIAPVKD